MSDRSRDWPRQLEIHPSVFLAAGSVVTGEVRIGERSSVWFQTVVRGDTDSVTIGAETNLQDLTLVHVDHGQPTVIGDRVTVGHRAIVHGSTVESDCLIGMGVILLSGSRVGSGSLVAAGALVREGQEIPPGSLAVGAPARVIGPVSDAHREAIRSGAVHYANLSREYLAVGSGQQLPSLNDPRGALGAPPPPMTFEEWQRILVAVGQGPDRAAERLRAAGAAAFARAPGPGRWSACEVVVHLIESDRLVAVPRLEKLLTEVRPELPAVDLPAVRRAAPGPLPAPAAAIEMWRAERSAPLARLAACQPADWERRGTHSVLGPYSVADLARVWAEHDAQHQLQIDRTLAEVS